MKTAIAFATSASLLFATPAFADTKTNPLERSNNMSMHEVYALHYLTRMTAHLHRHVLPEGASPDEFTEAFYEAEGNERATRKATNFAMKKVRDWEEKFGDDYPRYMVFCEEPAREEITTLAHKVFDRFLDRNPYGETGLDEIFNHILHGDMNPRLYMVLNYGSKRAEELGVNPDLAACNQPAGETTQQTRYIP
jgi:hypothetical protein